MTRLSEDVMSQRAERPELPVVPLADGAPELCGLLDRYLSEQTPGVAPVERVDAWHALEYFADAARHAESGKRTLPGTFRRWRKTLLEEHGGLSQVLQALKATELAAARDESGARPVSDAIRYLVARVARMDYAGAKTRGLPIGSGLIRRGRRGGGRETRAPWGCAGGRAGRRSGLDVARLMEAAGLARRQFEELSLTPVIARPVESRSY